MSSNRHPPTDPPDRDGIPPRARTNSHRLVHLSLQPMAEGQASYAHVYELAAHLRTQGWDVDVRTVGATPADGALRRALAGLRTQVRLGRLDAYDALYVRWHPLSLLAVLRARRSQVPVVLEVNGPPADVLEAWPRLRPIRGLVSASLRTQLRRADAVIAVSGDLADWLQRWTPSEVPVELVPNAANPDRFHPAATNDHSEQDPYALFFGALAPWQGLDTLIEAARSDDWPDHLRLCIVGDGPLRPEVLSLERELPQRVRYLGVAAYDDVPSLVSGSEMAVIPKGERLSELGASPLKLYEAMAAGTPVIVTDIPGVGDVVEAEGCGIVVPTGQPRLLAEAVRRLADSPALRQRLGAQGRRAALARHSWQHRAERTAEIIQAARYSGTGGRRGSTGPS